MVPSTFVLLDSLPLSQGGKVDRRLLPAPEGVRKPEDPAWAPRNTLEAQLCDIWAGVLGVERVDIDDNFFNLSGNSLALIRVVAEARRANLTIAAKEVYEHQTVMDLAVHLARRSARQRSTGDRLGPASPVQDGFAALVTLRPAGRRRPLFCVHPGGGSVTWYRSLLPRLDPNVPLYALQLAGLDGTCPPLESVEDMAAFYLAELRRVQPAPAGCKCLSGRARLRCPRP